MNFLSALAAISRGVSKAKEARDKKRADDEERQWRKEDRSRQAELDTLKLDDAKKKYNFEWNKDLNMGDVADPANQTSMAAIAPMMGVAGMPQASSQIMSDLAPLLSPEIKQAQSSVDMGVSVPRKIPYSLDTKESREQAKLDMKKLQLESGARQNYLNREAQAEREQKRIDARQASDELRMIAKIAAGRGGRSGGGGKTVEPKFTQADFQPTPIDMAQRPAIGAVPDVSVPPVFPGVGIPSFQTIKEPFKPVLQDRSGFKLGPNGRYFKFSEVTPELFDMLRSQGWAIPETFRPIPGQEKFDPLEIARKQFPGFDIMARTDPEKQKQIIDDIIATHQRFSGRIGGPSASGFVDQLRKAGLIRPDL